MQEQTERTDSKVRILGGTKEEPLVQQPTEEGEPYIEPSFWFMDSSTFEREVCEPLRALGFNMNAHMLQFRRRVRRETAHFYLGALREQLTPEQAAVLSSAFQDKALLQEIFGAPGRGTR